MATGVPERLETVTLPVADLVPYYRNSHQGNIPRIRASLREHGQFKPIVVNDGRLTGRPMEVLCGSHTLLAALAEGWTELAAVVVDVDEQRAAKINLVDNPRPNHPEDLGYDDRLLLEQLAELDDLTGAGYDPGDLDDLIAALDEPTPGRGGDVRGHQSPSLDERGRAYEAAGTHVVILSYPNDRYQWVVEQLGKLAADRGLESNADTVLALITDATGVGPPGGWSQ